MRKNYRHVFCRFCLATDDFMLRHYDSGPCRSRLGHSRISVVWHRTQVHIPIESELHLIVKLKNHDRIEWILRWFRRFWDWAFCFWWRLLFSYWRLLVSCAGVTATHKTRSPGAALTSLTRRPLRSELPVRSIFESEGFLTFLVIECDWNHNFFSPFFSADWTRLKV